MKLTLKERQFAPTGKSLGEFTAADLESFDLQWTESDEDKNNSNNGSDAQSSKVPPPLDNTQEDEDKNQDLDDIPDTWDPYGQDLDSKDGDEYTPPSSGEEDGYSGGSSGSTQEAESDSSDTSDTDSESSTNASSSGSEGTDSASNQSDSQDSSSGSQGSSGDSGEGSDQEQGSDGGSQSDDSSNSDNSSGDSSSGNQSQSSSGKRAEGTADGERSESGGRRLNNDGKTGNGQDIHTSGGTPSDEELEAEDDDFDLGTLSDLEKALETIEDNTSSSAKQRNASEKERSETEESTDKSYRDKESESQTLRDMAGKALKDMQNEEDSMSSKGVSRQSNEPEESQEDILKDMGLGNITSLFNPGNLQDWRTRLTKLFERALGFDIVTNPNLINKKIEDAPPGREDEIPQIKNIIILLDMSGSMGAIQFKQVIMHVDTMIRARKLSNVWFHIVPFGSSYYKDVSNKYTRVKGKMLKTKLMTEYKRDFSWMTDFLPGVQFCARTVKRPDAIIVMTDAQFNGSHDEFMKDNLAKSFMHKHKNKIIWALTANARLSDVTEYDSTAVSKKRYIKFKKGGS